MWPFTCNHPIKYLAVEKEQTITRIDNDFECVSYHFVCSKCNEQIRMSHAKTIHGVKEFMGNIFNDSEGIN